MAEDGNCKAIMLAELASPRFLGSRLGMGSFAFYLLQPFIKWHQALDWIPVCVYPSMYKEIKSLVKWYF